MAQFERRSVAPFPGILVLNHVGDPDCIFVSAADIVSMGLWIGDGIVADEGAKFCAVNVRELDASILVLVDSENDVRELAKIWAMERTVK